MRVGGGGGGRGTGGGVQNEPSVQLSTAEYVVSATVVNWKESNIIGGANFEMKFSVATGLF